MWVKVAPTAALVVVLIAAHFYFAYTDPGKLPVVQRLFFLPLFMSSLLFGLVGGISCAALFALTCLPWVFGQGALGCDRADLAMQLGLLFVTGIVTGALVDRERREAKAGRRRQEMAMMGEAAAAVAHELKTPLVAIGGFALRMQRDLPPDHPHAEKLRIIVDQVARMEKLLRDMLDFTRPLALKLQPQSMVGLVHEAVALSSEAAKNAQVTLVTEITEEDLTVELDRSRIMQVVLNLLQNAVHASLPGSTVTISVTKQDEDIRIKVADQGGGISPRHLDEIFNPFFTTKQRGTGLGLPISQRIVQAHGGVLEVESKQEEGSAFTVVLPPPRD